MAGFRKERVEILVLIRRAFGKLLILAVRLRRSEEYTVSGPFIRDRRRIETVVWRKLADIESIDQRESVLSKQSE